MLNAVAGRSAEHIDAVRDGLGRLSHRFCRASRASVSFLSSVGANAAPGEPGDAYDRL